VNGNRASLRLVPFSYCVQVRVSGLPNGAKASTVVAGSLLFFSKFFLFSILAFFSAELGVDAIFLKARSLFSTSCSVQSVRVAERDVFSRLPCPRPFLFPVAPL